jgi:hypothetical protein
MKTNTDFWSFLDHFFLEWEMFQTKVVEKIKKTHFMLVTLFFLKSCRSWGNVKKCGRTWQDTDDSMALAHYMLDTKGHRHTHSKYVILIALPRQQWLHERPSLLRYSHRTLSVFLLYPDDDDDDFSLGFSSFRVFLLPRKNMYLHISATIISSRDKCMTGRWKGGTLWIIQRLGCWPVKMTD